MRYLKHRHPSVPNARAFSLWNNPRSNPPFGGRTRSLTRRRRHARLRCLLTVSLWIPTEWRAGGQPRQLTATSQLPSPHESAFVYEGKNHKVSLSVKFRDERPRWWISKLRFAGSLTGDAVATYGPRNWCFFFFFFTARAPAEHDLINSANPERSISDWSWLLGGFIIKYIFSLHRS